MHSSDRYIISSVDYSDYIELIKLYQNFHAESYARDIINFDTDTTINFLNSLLENPDRHFAVKCTVSDEIIGFYMGSISTMDFSSTPIGFERGFYVKLNFRGSRVASLLKQSYFDWLLAKGIKPTISSIFHSGDNELTYKFCRKMNMHKVGEIYERIL